VAGTDTYKLYAKTGWTGSAAPQTGWYAGYIETKGGAWVFATNMTLQSQSGLPLRQSLTMAALEAAGIVPAKEKPEAR
jgi:beta-lactamase class D